MKSNEDISSAMNWYKSLKTEELAKVHPYVNEMDSMTIVKYWVKNIKG